MIKHAKNIIKICASLLVLCAILLLPFKAHAATASLYLSPATGTIFVGRTFDVSVFVDTAKNNINAAKVDIKFDPQKLQIASPTAGKSFISIWIAQPTFSNTEGTISFQGGTPSPGINTSSGLVSTITFRAIAPGKTTISILDSSQVLLDDGKGTNILGSTAKGIYEITIPPPEGPKVFSTSHPNPNQWYKNNNPVFNWEKEEGVIDFSYIIDQSPYTVPDNEAKGGDTSASFSDLSDGIWYFHIKARKDGTWGGASHYLVQIDTSPPAEFTPEIEHRLKIPGTTLKRPTIHFLTTDAASGIDHYEVKTIKLLAAEKTEVSFFVEGTSPYIVPISDSGEYEIIIRAYDLAGNWRDASLKVEIIDSLKLFHITKKGISVLGIFLFWWQIILLLILLLIIITFLFWWWRKKHRSLEERRKHLRELKDKIAKDEAEINKQISPPAS